MVLCCVILMLQVETGLDVAAKSGFSHIAGKNVAVLTNHTAIDRDGRHLLDHLRPLASAGHFFLKAFLAPEHGFEGLLDREGIQHGVDQGSGTTIFSLYGEHREPTAEMLAGVDTVLIDLQDIGTRFYTYQTTVLYTLRACTAPGIEVVLLDRPNPIGGIRVGGPVLQPDLVSFTGAYPMPVIHGMTMGELARLFSQSLSPKLNLQIVPARGWSRPMLFEDTGLIWVDPSPNMRNPNQALLYPAIGVWEYTNLSVGRGTDTPFERLGAPWLDGKRLARSINQAGLKGIAVIPRWFTPDSGPYAGKKCGGVQILLRDPEAFEPIQFAYALFQHLRTYESFETKRALKLLGNRNSLNKLMSGQSVEEIIRQEREDLAPFLKQRARVLIYPE